MIKIELVKGQWKKLEKTSGTIQLVSTSQESEMLIKTSETGSVPTDDIGFKIGSWQGYKCFDASDKSVFVKLVKGTGFLLIDDMHLGTFALIKNTQLPTLQVETEQYTRNVDSTVQLSAPTVAGYSSPIFELADSTTQVITVTPQGLVTAKSQGQAIVNCYFTKPVKTLAKKSTIIVPSQAAV